MRWTIDCIFIIQFLTKRLGTLYIFENVAAFSVVFAKYSCYLVSENSPTMSQCWSLKMVWASFLMSVVLQISLWFLIFDVVCLKMTSQKKSLFALNNSFGEFSYKESKMFFF